MSNARGAATAAREVVVPFVVTSDLSERAVDPLFVDALFSWWETARRERDRLPWRSTRDPWQVLVAETMLAQTQTVRVAERYVAFLETFPTVAHCAAAPLGDVVKAWVGLGYNRRAVSLHRAALRIVDCHGGKVPCDLSSLLALPGVGPYTARAILSFAYGIDTAVVDTNIARVLARAVSGRSLGRAAVQALGDSLVPSERSRAWNLALMDFGSLVCTSRTPRCEDCVLQERGACAWRRADSLADPAIGTAGVTRRQSTFVGSDRQGRGRLVRAACAGPIRAHEVATIAGWPHDSHRAERVARELIDEGLLTRDHDGSLCLR